MQFSNAEKTHLHKKLHDFGKWATSCPSTIYVCEQTTLAERKLFLKKINNKEINANTHGTRDMANIWELPHAKGPAFI